MDVREILEEVKKGTMDTAAAEELLRANPASRSYEEMGYAKLDTDRRERSGFAEVVYCQGKSDKFIADIFQKLYELDGEVFGTRASSHQYELVKERIPDISYDPVSHILKKEKEGKKRIGCVAVCTGGTADISVAEEAAQILSKETLVRSANCVVAVAGMEGALASVIGGLVKNPVIAVPTSVGYGASFHGLSALLTMINSCANGIVTVNIDNGFGAGYVATQINRLAERGKSSE